MSKNSGYESPENVIGILIQQAQSMAPKDICTDKDTNNVFPMQKRAVHRKRTTDEKPYLSDLA